MIPAIGSRWQWRFVLWLLVMMPMAMVAAEQAGPVKAQWRAYELQFNYSSFYTYYNCYSFDDKLAQVLKQLGAKDDVRVSTLGCYGSHELGNMLTSRVKVQMPVAAAASGESFDAGYRSVLLKSRELSDSGSGDCELLEQVRDQLLPALHLSVTKNAVRCFPGQAMLNTQTLEVQALVAEPAH